MFDSDHECRGFTSPEGETGPSQHQDSSSSPEQDQTYHYSEPLSGNPGCVSPAGDEPLGSIKNDILLVGAAEPDKDSSTLRGAFSLKYSPNACRGRNEALDEGEAAGHQKLFRRDTSILQFEAQVEDNVIVPVSPGEDSRTMKEEKFYFSRPQETQLKIPWIPPITTQKPLFSLPFESPPTPPLSRKKQKVSLVPAGKKEKNESIWKQESWDSDIHQQIPEVRKEKTQSFKEKKAISCSKSKDESLIIQQSSDSQNSEAFISSSEMHSISKISYILIQEPLNYDKAFNPIEKHSNFSVKNSMNINREREPCKQPTEIEKTVSKKIEPVQLFVSD
jgi:hypothetical protein